MLTFIPTCDIPCFFLWFYYTVTVAEVIDNPFERFIVYLFDIQQFVPPQSTRYDGSLVAAPPKYWNCICKMRKSISISLDILWNNKLQTKEQKRKNWEKKQTRNIELKELCRRKQLKTISSTRSLTYMYALCTHSKHLLTKDNWLCIRISCWKGGKCSGKFY